jgi:hypothetical protein
MVKVYATGIFCQCNRLPFPPDCNVFDAGRKLGPNVPIMRSARIAKQLT